MSDENFQHDQCVLCDLGIKHSTTKEMPIVIDNDGNVLVSKMTQETFMKVRQWIDQLEQNNETD
jgi:hypothetical protein